MQQPKLYEHRARLFSTKDFLPNFKLDLIVARRLIKLICPFASAERLRVFKDMLVEQDIDSNVQIVLITRHPISMWYPEKVREALGELRELGVEVQFCARLHQKIAIIDNRIAWHGSLNLLCDNPSKDSMMRFTDTATVLSIVQHAQQDISAFANQTDLYPHTPEKSLRCQECLASVRLVPTAHSKYSEFQCVRFGTDCEYRVPFKSLA